MTIARLVLWRHGQTSWNAIGRIQGHTDVHLDKRGQAQAKRAAPTLAAFSPTAIVASDLARAADTAAHLAELTGLPVQVDDRLRENHFGAWEGLTDQEVMDGWPEQYVTWRTYDPAFVPPGGCSPLETGARAAAVVAELDEATSGTVVAAAHGGTIRALTATLLGLPHAQWRALGPIGNCHWVRLRRTGFGWQLVGYNAAAVSR